MKMEEINKLFSAKVSEYLSNGWIINPQTMRGWGGNEIAKVDVTDGKTILRIILEDFRDWYESDGCGESVYRVEINLYREVSGGEPFTRFYSAKWDVVETQCFYCMPRSNDNWYVTDVDEIMRATKKHKERFYARLVRHNIFREFPVTKNLLPLVRRFPKCKTVHLEDIERVTCNLSTHTYDFRVKGKVHSVKLSAKEKAC